MHQGCTFVYVILGAKVLRTSGSKLLRFANFYRLSHDSYFYELIIDFFRPKIVNYEEKK